jgi:hypothetical protein
MKEYKVLYAKIQMSKDKTTKDIEDELNKIAGEGWELKIMDGPLMVFEREKD